MEFSLWIVLLLPFGPNVLGYGLVLASLILVAGQAMPVLRNKGFRLHHRGIRIEALEGSSRRGATIVRMQLPGMESILHTSNTSVVRGDRGLYVSRLNEVIFCRPRSAA